MLIRIITLLLLKASRKNDNKRKSKLCFYRPMIDIKTNQNFSSSYYFIILSMHEYLNIILYLDYI